MKAASSVHGRLRRRALPASSCQWSQSITPAPSRCICTKNSIPLGEERFRITPYINPMKHVARGGARKKTRQKKIAEEGYAIPWIERGFESVRQRGICVQYVERRKGECRTGAVGLHPRCNLAVYRHLQVPPPPTSSKGNFVDKWSKR